jgi:hypothetical protein
MSTIEQVRNDWTDYTLANAADVALPDKPDSPGAKFLIHVRDAVLEAVEWEIDQGRELAEAVEAVRDGGIHEIADGAPDVYTYQRWQEFVDLAAWQEDISEYGDMGDDLTGAAGVALYMIAERVTVAILDDLEPDEDDEDDEDES